nr:hypothetical protein [uncultured Mediterranean phage uvMED]
MITTRQVIDLIETKPETYAGLDPYIMRLYRKWVPVNQTVISGYENYALELKRFGDRDRYSIVAITERLRWDSYLRQDGEEYKLNNNYSAPIARTLMALNPELRGMFQTRDKFFSYTEKEVAYV